jgi:F-type H+-transporting ATPase subunit gamma
MSIYDIKKKLEVLNLFEKSTSAMRLVSLSLYHQLKKIIPQFKNKFLINKDSIENYFENISLPSNNQVYLFLSSDRGFCGDFISNMLQQFKILYEKNKEQGLYIIIGKMLFVKIQKIYKSENIILISLFKISNFDSINKTIISILAKNNVKILHVYYTKSINISKREIEYNSFYSDYTQYILKKDIKITLFDLKTTIEPLIKYFLHDFILYFFYESLFAEQGARFIAMENALKNTNEAIDTNKKLYFKVRQQKINNQLQDLVSSLL